MSRSVAAIVAAVVVLAVSACGTTTVAGTASPTSPASASGGYAPDVPARGAPPRFQPAVPEPKDARGIAACDLLTEAQLTELGLRPETAEETSTGNTRSCSWSSVVDDTNPAGLELNDETTIPVLDGLYLTRDVFANYEPREVAGHPAVRVDYSDLGDCTIITAIADYQGVGTEGNPAGRPQPDPCALSMRMAEFIIANLPPLIEE